ncbi:MAG TPA: glycerol-3-phosphate 1-O-acyltransferase PlsY [Firmicutes bacterium]|nr:glycerol-3-phosphate 1-O-acyltransferase PlsY [Bacillota bacterium]
MFLLILAILLTAFVSYLLGSLNFAIIISRILLKKDDSLYREKQVERKRGDIRDFGSGNGGMTNILRTFGKGPAVLTTLGDLLKGIFAVLLGRFFFIYIAGMADFSSGEYIAAAFALLGHMFPLYYGFKGGKGIMTSAGVLLVIDPIVCMMILGVFLVVVLISRIVSLSSICAAVAYPLATLLLRFLQHADGYVILRDSLFALAIAILVIFMHRSNIQRLLNGTEARFNKKSNGK